MTGTPLERASCLHGRGFAVIPISAGSKIPGDNGWQKLRITDAELPKYFNGQRQNIGILNGAPSGNCVDVDLDCAEAVKLAPKILPRTDFVFGRPGKPASHWYFRVDPLVATVQYRDTRDTETPGGKKRPMLVELRSDGSQTIAPGSTHQGTGELIEFDRDGEPAEVDGQLLAASAGKLAAASLLARHWPGLGSRHHCELALAGGLIRAGWSEDDVTDFIGMVSEAGGGERGKPSRLRVAADTARAITAGQHATGWKTLVDLMDGKTVAKAKEWLGISSADEQIASTLQRSAATAGETAEQVQAVALTELRAAEELAGDHPTDFVFNTAAGRFMVFDRRWVHDDTGQVNGWGAETARKQWRYLNNPPPNFNRKAVMKHCIRMESSGGIAAMLRIAQTLPGVPVAPSQFDVSPFDFNVLNCTLDLRTGNPRPHSKSDRITKLAPVTYDPAATCPLFEGFVDRIMAGNKQMIAYLRRLAGLCQTGDASVQELYIAYGGGANGKSVFFDALHSILGDYAGMASDGLLTARAHQEHPTELADLQGKRLVVASETEEGAKLRIQLVKKLTGDKTIKGRYMRQDFFEFPRTHKLILVTNNKPVTRETTNAIWRRVRLIPFTVTIPKAEQDESLLAKLIAESAGILNWCIRGCLDWQRNGMQTPAEVMLATELYQAEQDVIGEYIAERCIIDGAANVSRAALYADYIDWAKTVGDHQPMERNAFFERMRRVDGIGETMLRMNGTPTRVFSGIGLANLGVRYSQAQSRIGGVTP